MGKFAWVFVALAAGALIPVQGGLNARVGEAIKSPLFASLVSFAIGTVVVAAFTFFGERHHVSWAAIRAAPWYAWLGGFCGAFSLTATIYAYPKLGPALAFGLLVAGQLVISLALEHFHVLTEAPHPLTVLRVVGLLLVFGGVALIRAF